MWHNEVNYSLSGRWKSQGVSHFCELLLNTHINYIGFTSVKRLSGGCLRILLIEYKVSTGIDFVACFCKQAIHCRKFCTVLKLFRETRLTWLSLHFRCLGSVDPPWAERCFSTLKSLYFRPISHASTIFKVQV